MRLTNTASLASPLTVAKLSYGCALFSEGATSITSGKAGQSPTLSTPHQRGTPVLRRGDRRVAITCGRSCTILGIRSRSAEKLSGAAKSLRRSPPGAGANQPCDSASCAPLMMRLCPPGIPSGRPLASAPPPWGRARLQSTGRISYEDARTPIDNNFL